MSNKSTHRYLLSVLVALLLGAAGIGAQNTTSPYSRYGYGLLGDNATSAQRQMGSTGYAMHSGRQINVMNPASYAYADSMTFLFDMGTDLSLFWRKDNTGKQRDWGGGIDYITMQVPLSKTMGMSFGLLPYSSVGYAFGRNIDNGSATNQGSGGLNQLYLGAGWTPFKGFAIGFNASYLWGNITNDVYAYSSQGQTAVFEQHMEVADYHFSIGALYSVPLNRKSTLSIGVNYEPGKSLLGKTYVTKYLSGSSAADIDTIAPGIVRLHNRFSLASSYGAGIAWDYDDRIHVEADFTYQPWKDAKYTQLENFTSTKLDNRYKIALGASVTPDPRGGYFKRMTYRAGGFYNRDYIMVDGNHVRDYSVSVGLGFPAFGSKTLVNLGFEYRNRQATPNPLLKEQYFNITLGVNINQVWFFRNKLR